MDAPWVIFGPSISAGSHSEYARQIVGAKAAELARLPLDWTPHFAVITTGAYRLWREHAQTGEPGIRGTPEWPELQSQLSSAIGKLVSVGAQRLMARSSADHETLRDRGRYDSIPCNCDLQSVSDAVFRIWGTFHEQHSENDAPNMAIMLQVYVTPTVAGHLSNERRISRKANKWLCELEETLQKNKHIPITIRNRAPQARSLDFRCDTSEDLKKRLHQLAEVLTSETPRHHIEWIWDSTRLWIVQCDPEGEYIGERPGNMYSGLHPQPVNPLRVFLPEREAHGAWHKIEAVRTFRACNLPTANVFVLENAKVLKEIASGSIRMDLRRDLAQLLLAPIVIRTDVDSLLPDNHFLLPTTYTIHDIETALQFIKQTAAQLVRGGIAPTRFCFIAHRFITATACAQAFSAPGVPRVRIDSSWGLPDGLQFYPHDSFEVRLSRPSSITTHIRCKSEYLDGDERGTWVEKRAGAPWDWKPSLTKDQLQDIARFAAAISNHLKKPVDVMVFVGVNPATGHPPCLPWYYTTERIHDTSEQGSYSRFAGRRVTVSTGRDIETLAKRAASGERLLGTSVHLRPAPDLMRSFEFLQRVGSFCHQNALPIELEGSLLSHAYYVLARMGVGLRCLDPFQPPARRQRFGKLVRNLIPLRIESHGEAATVRRVSRAQLVRLLKAKAVEEALELNAESDPDKTFEELADVLEVISTICDLYDRRFDELRATADKKRAERGGFEKGLVLVETKEVPLLGRELSGLFSEQSIQRVSDRIIETPGTLKAIDEPRQIRATAQGMRISLVPPDPASRRRRYTVPLREHALEAVVEYTDKEIIVSLKPIIDSKKNHWQLWLPFAGPGT